MSAAVFKFVPAQEWLAWAALGWKLHDSLEGTHHAANGVLMEWDGQGEHLTPQRMQEQEAE